MNEYSGRGYFQIDYVQIFICTNFSHGKSDQIHHHIFKYYKSLVHSMYNISFSKFIISFDNIN